MNRQVYILRFWLACIALIVAVLTAPDPTLLMLWPLSFLFNCCCNTDICGASTPACTVGTRPSSVTIDISGITGTCAGAACATLDGLYVLPYREDLGNGCRYFLDFADFCASQSNAINGVDFNIQTAAGQVDLVATFLTSHAGQQASFFLNNYAASPLDCSTIGTQLLPPFLTGHLDCDFSAAVCNVTV